MMAVGASLGRSGAGSLTMLETAQGVIAARTELMAAAIASPMTADHAELARMAPEKIEAFSRAGLAASSVWLEFGSAWLRYGQDMTAMWMRGRVPTTAETTLMARRWGNLMLGSVETAARLGAVSLAPLQKQVRANARRLRLR